MIPLDRQNRYRQRYRALYPAYRDSGTLYETLFASHLTKDARVLDAGCGRDGVLGLYAAHTSLALGLDSDFASLREQRNAIHRAQATLEHIPCPAASFDLILCTWVVEHLPAPAVVFAEFARVLRPGGHLHIITPSAWNYLILANRLTPNSLRARLVERLYGRGQQDTFRVHYKANTPVQLNRLLQPLGFRLNELYQVGDPSYIAFNELSFRLGVLLDRVAERGFLRQTQAHIVACYLKGSANNC